MVEQMTLGDMGEEEYMECLPLVEVQPIHYKERRNKEYEDRYSFIEVHIDDMNLNHFYDDAIVRRTGLGIWYLYGSSDPILITEVGTYRRMNTSQREAQMNSYFALSKMDEYGCVSGWMKE